MKHEDFIVDTKLNSNLLLEKFLVDCHELIDEHPDDSLCIAYLADSIAMIYYHREYATLDEFLEENEEFIDEDKKEWVINNWAHLDQMSEGERAELIIESVNQIQFLVS
ncbi:MAG: hypothetical protein HRT47_03850 [Candidatus Caenarcaniphilales bacterium]|nr:hypothetical protein [Candidatus Caenarcaniphilales bacterium]